MKKNKNVTAEYQAIFEEYFGAYYAENRDVQNISYREMFDEKKKSIGFTAEIEYKAFKQNVNIFWNGAAPLLVNSVFIFNSSKGNYCCHFVDVLDYYDSDDISFYTYTHCTDKERTIEALNNVMNATKQYWNQLNEVATTPSISQSIFEEIYDDAIDEEDAIFDTVEEATDFAFFTYEILYKRDELKAHLKRGAKKNKLETKFEKRAWRVLSNESFFDVRGKEKQREKSHSYSKSDKTFIGALIGGFVVVFAIVFAIIGYKIDSMLFADWIGRSSSETVFAFVAIGCFTGLSVLGLIPTSAFKSILSEKRYKSLEAYEMAEKSPKWMKIAAGVCYAAVCAFLLIVFCFNGIGFNSNGDIMNKDFMFSDTQTYKIEETEIVIVNGYEDDGYNEYDETAYAFKLGDDWIDYGIPDDESKPVIEKAIEGRNIKTYKTIEDIE